MKSKKILITIVIVLLIIIALAGTVTGMIMTGRVAITSRQKLAKGLSDLSSKISVSELEEKFKQYEKLQDTPFEAETAITASINRFQLENLNNAEEILKEIKNVAQTTKITNTMQADLKNKIIKSNLKVNAGDIVNEISADVEYTGDRLSLRAKELNEKYFTFTKGDIEENSQYVSLAQIFDLFESIYKQDKKSIYLTEDEKAYFDENYKDILSNYIKDDMIKEEEASIIIEGETKNCSNVNFTLSKNQIAELIGEYLKKLEEDGKGKEIIVSKIKSIVNTFEEDDLLELIVDLKNELLYLDDNATLKVSTYCTMFKTYGIDFELYDGESNGKVSIILGSETERVSIIVDEETIMEATKSDNEIIINFKAEEISMVMNIKNEDKKSVIDLKIKDTEDKLEGNIIFTSEELTNNDNENTSKDSVQFIINDGENNIDITLNIDSSLKYINSIETTTIENSNSVDLVTASQEDLQQYMSVFIGNAAPILQKAVQNPGVQKIYTLYKAISQNSIKPSELDATSFNNMFKNYTGIQNGVAMKELMQNLANSNKTYTHKVSVAIIEDGTTVLNSTSNEQELTNASMFNINAESQYTIYVTSVSGDGYIEAIEIRK